MKHEDDTAVFMHLFSRLSWLENPEELMQTHDAKKKATRLSMEEAGCPGSNPELIDWFFQFRHYDDEIEFLAFIFTNFVSQ